MLLKWLRSPRYPAVVIILLAVGAGWIWYSAAPAGATTAGNIPAPQAGFLAPDFTLADVSGDQVQLSALRGKPVILNLWASWCTPCRAEMPALQNVYLDFKDSGLVILAINSTVQDSREAALSFASERGLTFPILFDDQGKVSEMYQLRALPTTFFIRPDGVIEEVVIGGPMAEALLRTRVQRLLEGVP